MQAWSEKIPATVRTIPAAMENANAVCSALLRFFLSLPHKTAGSQLPPLRKALQKSQRSDWRSDWQNLQLQQVPVSYETAYNNSIRRIINLLKKMFQIQ